MKQEQNATFVFQYNAIVLADAEPETLRETLCLEQTEQGFRRREAGLTGAVGPFLSRQSSSSVMKVNPSLLAEVFTDFYQNQNLVGPGVPTPGPKATSLA